MTLIKNHSNREKIRPCDKCSEENMVPQKQQRKLIYTVDSGKEGTPELRAWRMNRSSPNGGNDRVKKEHPSEGTVCVNILQWEKAKHFGRFERGLEGLKCREQESRNTLKRHAKARRLLDLIFIIILHGKMALIFGSYFIDEKPRCGV